MTVMTIVSRRDLIAVTPVLAGLVLLKARPRLSATNTVTRADIDQILETKNPQNHCGENHDHSDESFDDWKGSLVWSTQDCGHNEGAGPVVKLAVNNGLSYPALMRGCHDSEQAIPVVDEIMKDPSQFDALLKEVPPDKSPTMEQVTAVRQALKEGKSFTEILVMAPPDAVGEVWRRVAMMQFAKKLAREDKLAPAVAIATASQWHNCQAFRALLRHPAEIAQWLRA
jgi:hypothetical protein